MMATAVVFTGQGPQYPEMVEPWLRHPLSAAMFAEASEILGYDLVDACRFESVRLNTRVAQPALFVCGLAGYRILAGRGFSAVAVAGHSLGEFAGLVAAGALEFAPALEVVRERAEATADAAQANPGVMTAVLGPHAHAHAAVAVVAGRGGGGGLAVAVVNGPRQVVLSGSVGAVERAETMVRELGSRSVRLPVPGAFHSPLIAAAFPRVAAAVERLTWSVPTVPVVPNVTGVPTRDPGVLADALRRHLLEPVRWHRTLRAFGRLGVTRIVECGPARVLGPLAHRAWTGRRGLGRQQSDIQTLLVRCPDDALAVANPVLAAA